VRGGTFARLTRGGFGTNLTTGRSNYNKDIIAGRGTIEVHGEKIFARLTGDYTHDLSNRAAAIAKFRGNSAARRCWPMCSTRRRASTAPSRM
jgi:hypothetical protein